VTVTSSAPFALELAARAQRRHPSSAPLKVRCCLVGADRIEPRHVAAAVEAMAPHGVGEEAVTPAYGLAEATLAVSLGALREPPATVAVDGAALVEGRVVEAGPGAQRLVSAGRPLPGFEVRIDGAAGDLELGELRVRGPSLASGYLGDGELTAERFRDGEVRTRDLGFTHGGELYVVGRIDDVLIVGGRNVHVAEIESGLGDDRRVRRGAVAVVDLHADGDGTRYVAVAETDGHVDDARALARDMQALVLGEGGVALDECVFVPRGSFPRTPSGKPQRFRCRAIAAAPPPGAERVALRVS
jgi:fatty-acyl-CoA synthase